jgi:hypothetical protein
MTGDPGRLDRIVAQARREAEQREQGYRERALKMYPWICGRCAREFTRANLRELTVHHRNHNHDDNPADGSNWELLCVYCHDNEHQRQTEARRASRRRPAAAARVARGTGPGGRPLRRRARRRAGRVRPAAA